jgi:hypothetical protein
MITSDDVYTKFVHGLFPPPQADQPRVIEPIKKPEPTKTLLARIKQLRNKTHA